MTAEDHVALLEGGVVEGTWADLGAGSGAFTTALARLLGPTATIYAVDVDARALREAGARMADAFPPVLFTAITADFTASLDLPLLDGICMANSLHFHRDHCGILRHVTRLLKPSGRLLLVEYDIDRPSPWVPYPLHSTRLAETARCAGLAPPQILGTRPSRWHGRVYSALLRAPSD